MTKRQFLAIMYLLTGVIPLIAQTFTEQKRAIPSVQTAINMWSADLPLSAACMTRTSTLMHCYGLSKCLSAATGRDHRGKRTG